MKNSKILLGLAVIGAAAMVVKLFSPTGIPDELAFFTFAFFIGGCICESIERLPELLVAEDVPTEERDDA